MSSPLFGGVRTPLFTDLYELTMAAAYHANGITGRATFEAFVRALPERRNFLVACGLEELLDALHDWRFCADDIEYLRSLGQFRDDFLAHLADLRFTGDIRAVAEGEVVFEGEPIVEISAPIIEAQLIETLVLNLIGSRTMQASKAVRVALACQGRAFVDFSARRDHGVDAALGAARASAIAGAAATSLVEAGRRYGLHLSGTMAHAYVMAFDDERDAFRSFARTFPGNAVLLLDTWDTVAGAHHVVEVARELRAEGITIDGVRLDSGDLAVLSQKVREILDAGGCSDVRIFASGDLDEYRIDAFVRGGARIDGFGVGTRMGTSEDAPSLGVVYKLVEDEHGPKLKLAEGKATLPGRKQLHRRDGFDVISLAGEDVDGRALLHPVIESGRRMHESEPIETSAQRCGAAVAALPARLRRFGQAEPPYEVRVSAGLHALGDELTAAHRG
ncbi:MAG TPA: nicotinate phosphoribosyltransferase [Acidimicrobiales bacterium]